MKKPIFIPRSQHVFVPLLRNLEVYLAKRDLDPLVQMAIAFAQLLIIHPFMNGNGRVARIFIPVFAVRKKLLTQPALFLSEHFEAHRNDYFQKLFFISEKNAWEDWIAYFLTGVISQTKKTVIDWIVSQNCGMKLCGFPMKKVRSLLFHQPLVSRDKAMDV